MGKKGTFGGPTLKRINFNKKSNLKKEKISIPKIKKNSISKMAGIIVSKKAISDLLRNNHTKNIHVGGPNSSRKNLVNREVEQSDNWSGVGESLSHFFMPPSGRKSYSKSTDDLLSHFSMPPSKQKFYSKPAQDLLQHNHPEIPVGAIQSSIKYLGSREVEQRDGLSRAYQYRPSGAIKRGTFDKSLELCQDGQTTRGLRGRLKVTGPNLEATWEEVESALDRYWPLLRDKMRIYCHRSYSKYPHVIISTSTSGIWYISISSNKCLVSQMLAMETFIKILLSAIILIKVKGEKNM